MASLHNRCGPSTSPATLCAATRIGRWSPSSATRELKPSASRHLNSGEAAMGRSGDHQICFQLADAVPAASLPGPLRLGDAQAEALSELPQGFASGEESASLASAPRGGSPRVET